MVHPYHEEELSISYVKNMRFPDWLIPLDRTAWKCKSLELTSSARNSTTLKPCSNTRTVLIIPTQWKVFGSKRKNRNHSYSFPNGDACSLIQSIFSGIPLSRHSWMDSRRSVQWEIDSKPANPLNRLLFLYIRTSVCGYNVAFLLMMINTTFLMLHVFN